MIPLIKEFIAGIKNVRDALLEIPSKLDSLRKSVENQTSAIDRASEAAKEYCKTPPVVQAEVHVPLSPDTTKKTEPTEHKWRERTKLIVEMLTLIAVVWYAYEAHRQSRSVKDSADAATHSAQAATEQTRLLRLELVANSSAHVDVTPVPDSGPQPGNNVLHMEFSNTSRTIATDVRAEYQITKEVPKTGHIVSTQHIDYELPELLPNDPTTGAVRKKPEDVIHLSKQEVENLNTVDLTIRIQGNFHYWNGLDSAGKNFCYIYYGYNFPCAGSGFQYVRCDSYPGILESALKTKASCKK